ncbi:MAG: YhbY family RNA-binding protein [Verrucomicrobiota bacterium]
MLELSSKDRAALRGVAQRLKPAAQVGKNGVSEGLVKELIFAFKSEDLIKVAFKAERDEIPALVSKIEEETGSICVGGVGKKRAFYRPIDAE